MSSTYAQPIVVTFLVIMVVMLPIGTYLYGYQAGLNDQSQPAPTELDVGHHQVITTRNHTLYDSFTQYYFNISTPERANVTYVISTTVIIAINRTITATVRLIHESYWVLGGDVGSDVIAFYDGTTETIFTEEGTHTVVFTTGRLYMLSCGWVETQMDGVDNLYIPFIGLVITEAVP